MDSIIAIYLSIAVVALVSWYYVPRTSYIVSLVIIYFLLIEVKMIERMIQWENYLVIAIGLLIAFSMIFDFFPRLLVRKKKPKKATAKKSVVKAT